MQKKGIIESLAAFELPFSGEAIAIFKTLKIPTITFSVQYKNKIGKTFQSRKITPKMGRRLAKIKIMTLGFCKSEVLISNQIRRFNTFIPILKFCY